MPSLNSNIDLTGKIIDQGDVEIHGKDETVEENLTKLKGKNQDFLCNQLFNLFLHIYSF